MQDRLPDPRIATTHDILAKMMGTDRATVSLGIADFERRGLLRRHQGSSIITNRPKLLEGRANVTRLSMDTIPNVA
jgi:hypothetical protein